MTSLYHGVLPYCGAPPSPQLIWTRWNLDPILIAVLVTIAVAYAIGAPRARRQGAAPRARARLAFYSGWTIAVAALISPLCPLSVSLFSARVGQHMILALIAAPLVAAGRPGLVMRGLLPRSGPPTPVLRRSRASAPLLSTAVFALLLWFWHTPGPYVATFLSTTVYWSMHTSVFAGALWLWSTLLDRAPTRAMSVVGASLISSVQMGFLGALITFAPRPLYAPHALTTAAWGFTPLQDQQLGGAIMWIPGCVIFFAISMAALWLALVRAGFASSADSELA